MAEIQVEASIRDFWYSGELRFLCRRSAQLRLYDALHGEDHSTSLEPWVWKCHRRLGKSFVLALLLVERAINLPGQRCLYGAPTYEQVMEIVLPNLEIILRTCPKELRPKKSSYNWNFRNPLWASGSADSVVRIVGVDYKQGDRLRGAWADAIALDEVRDMTDPRYLWEHVLLYQFKGRTNPWAVLASTPPASADHEFESYFSPRALRSGRYKVETVETNQDWTEEDTELLSEAIGGGPGSISWRREALCEAVGDEDRLIIPEFQHVEHRVVGEESMPEHFIAESCLDTGWHDWNACLFGYVNFLRQVLVIQDEHVSQYKTTSEVAEAIRTKELDLWSAGKRVYRHADMDPQKLQDMCRDWKVPVLPVEKYDREAAIANFRAGLVEGRVLISPRAKNLIYQLRNGLWNKNRTGFERSPRLGHCDALMAAIYMYRMAHWRSNPYPQGISYNPDRAFLTPRTRNPKQFEALYVAGGKGA